MSAKDAALAVALTYGWHVFRLHIGHDEDACNGGTGNCKTIKVLGGKWNESNDPDVIEGWDWSRANGYGIATGPSGLFVADVDPGGEWDDDAARTHLTGRGVHYVYKDHIGLPSGTHVWPGVDTRGVGGMIVGPGSWHPHGGYTVGHDVSPTPVPQWLVEKIKSRKAAQVQPYDGPAYDTLTPEQQKQADAYVETVIFDWAASLAQASTWDDADPDAGPSEAGRDHLGRGWERLATDFAFSLMQLALAPWTALELDEAEAEYHRVLPDVLAANEKCRHKWTARRLAAAADRPLQPPWSDAPPVTSTSGGGGGGNVSVAVRMRQYVEANYDVFPSASDERVFMRPLTGGRAELVDGPAVMRACRPLNISSATMSAAATEAAKVLTAYAADAPARVVALRAHHKPGRVVLDLGRPDGSCVVVTADGWTVETTPPDDVVFAAWTRTDAALAVPERGGSVDELRELLGWKASDPNWLLVRGWLACALLGSIPRPMLAFLGKAGNGKTTVGRMLLGLLDPKPEGKLGSAFGKNRDDDESKALNNFLLAFDNLERVSEEGSNFLARLVTGDLVDKRKLYTSFGVVTAAYQRTGILTAIEMPTGLRADALDRLIPVQVVLPDARLNERDLWAAWNDARGRILGGVLDDLVLALGDGGENPDRLRMADYGSALWAVGEDLYRAYADNVHDARSVMAAGDPFVGTLVGWLTEVGGEWTGTADEAVRVGRLYARGWWPDSARSFGSMLARVGTLLDEVGVSVSENKPHAGPRTKTLRLASVPEPESLL
jgi:hypothetical protein